MVSFVHPRKLNQWIIKIVMFLASCQSRRNPYCLLMVLLPYLSEVSLYFLAHATWQVNTSTTVSTSVKSSAVHDWPPFCLWLLPRHSDPLGASLAYTLVILQQLPPISLCKRVSISRVAIIECTCRTNLPFHSHSTMSWTVNFLVCMNIYRKVICYQLDLRK